jgi:REP element-mobilizing transposase RayT
MAHTFTNLLCHCVFSTKERRALLKGEIAERIDPYMSGIASNHGMHLVRSGGTPDHRHLLLDLAPTMSVSEAMRVVKANSSKWLHETFPALHGLGWQEGYSAFSVSESAREKVVAYIDAQQDHHKKMSFVTELIALLDRHGIQFDPQDVLG